MTWKPIEVTKTEIAAFARAFHKKARFQLDESVDPTAADTLRSLGYNVKTPSDLHLVGHPDEDHLAAAHREDRILLTHDEDFLDDRKFPPHRDPGVVILPGGSGGIGALTDALRLLSLLVAPYREVWWASKVRITADGQIVVWGFEADSGQRRERRYKMTPGGPAMEWVDDES